ncbi:hypothetical protein [Pseudobacter ginsenosidimutans]|uniref:Uncharacterized protein n=1 Tax=Pseudobacter ginsenosidimutans TaxID=661488 RepID=A0A4Q7MS74_9BACT|nr:hypothetical protein [Pseudobacter ginsenosidimutans]QEC41872.1 hypothetical protein FSB84_09290 [Pseudobacter ginsenosidimutans]RZS71308.1 hypothetical protein EV199_3211 [Pseudobacter ginsenosidimutans]
MRIKSFLPGTFIFQTSLRPQDIEFIVLDKMPEPGFSPASRSYADYFGEADDTCFVIRGISQSNRPPRPVARAQMELMPQGGTRVIVRFGFAWRMKLFWVSPLL